ncbi:MAG: ParB/RepB/Spo0J family partition protein [Sporichthyaceae bacterium]|nr:ParB/RepB/Spo0J family partition protein [Sporichthyaceae bacterium]
MRTPSTPDPADLSAASDPVTTGESVMLDPEQLHPHPANPRETLTAIPQLAATIKALGQLQPVIAYPDPDSGYIIAFGHRRHAALQSIGRKVWCQICPSRSAAETLMAQIVENTHQVGLSAAEEAQGYQQLALMDPTLTAGKIAKMVGRKPDQVKAALASSTLDAKTRTRAATAGADLIQLAAMADFADDPAALDRLTKAVASGTGQFQHELSREHKTREHAAKTEATRKRLASAGTVLLDKLPDRHATPRPALRDLDELYGPEGQRLTAKNHRSCPGHAAYVETRYSYWGSDPVTYYCLDPKKHGHRSRPVTALAADELAHRRTVLANNAAWRAAEPVRQEFITNLCRNRKPPAGAAAYLTRLVAGGNHGLRKFLDSYEAAGKAGAYLGHEIKSHQELAAIADKAGTRLQNVQLAIIAAAIEARMGVNTWRSEYRWDTTEPDWLRYLVGLGYTLSDVEQLVITPKQDERRHAHRPTQPGLDDEAKADTPPADPNSPPANPPKTEPPADSDPAATA